MAGPEWRGPWQESPTRRRGCAAEENRGSECGQAELDEVWPDRIKRALKSGMHHPARFPRGRENIQVGDNLQEAERATEDKGSAVEAFIHEKPGLGAALIEERVLPPTPRGQELVARREARRSRSFIAFLPIDEPAHFHKPQRVRPAVSARCSRVELGQIGNVEEVFGLARVNQRFKTVVLVHDPEPPIR